MACKDLGKIFENTGPYSTQMVGPEWQVPATSETDTRRWLASSFGNVLILNG